MRLRKSVAAIAVALAGLTAGSAQGSELFFDFNANLNPPNASVFLFGNAGQTATVSNLAGFNQNVTLGVDGFSNLFIPSNFQQSGTGIKNTGFRVVSPDPIAGYFINRATATTDMTYLLDGGALGTNYVVASQGGGFGEGSQAAIHATQDGTNVTFTPKGGAPINVTLNAGETYHYAGGPTDLTGSTVTSNKPVAVFGGHECAQVPAGTTFCDTLLEQMVPTNKLSKTYAVTASQGAALASTTSDLMRVIATEDGTQVKVNGVLVATLNKGGVHEFSLANGTGALIEASAPVMVAQYLKGGGGANTDPAMTLVPGSDTWLKDYKLATPTGAQQFVVNYASLVILTSDLGSLLLNGVLVNTASFTPIAGTPYSRGNVTLPLGLFTLDAPDPFLVLIGGGSNADSYLTYGGATFAPGVSPPVEPVQPPTPGVPEPSTLLLLGMGALGLSLMRLRVKAR
jgi:hypothetical protein